MKKNKFLTHYSVKTSNVTQPLGPDICDRHSPVVDIRSMHQSMMSSAQNFEPQVYDPSTDDDFAAHITPYLDRVDYGEDLVQANVVQNGQPPSRGKGGDKDNN